MATITSAGVGSGLDVEGIVSKLMELEQKPLNRLDTKEIAYQAKITAYGAVKSNLASLQTAATTLATATTFTGKSATVSDTTVLSAAASSGAAAGSYSISVTQLAKYHAMRSNTNYAATSETFNTGSLAISIGGGAAVNVTIDGSSNSLAGIRQAINDADAGVTASIINDGTTNRLVLTSDTSGTAGAISVSVTDDGSGGTHALTQLNNAGLVQVQSADDAQFTINGLSVSRSSNTITDVVEGLTLNLTKGSLATPGTATITVARNTAATTSAIESFVNAYNSAVAYLKSSSAYNSTTKTGGPLNAEGTVRSIRSELSALSGTAVTGVAGGVDTLSSIGITMQVNGSLSIDSTTLQAALADPAKDLASLFGQTTVGNEGIALKFKTSMTSILAADGLLVGRTDGITTAIKDIGTTRESLLAKLDKIEARYRAKFAALDGLAASMSRTSQYLSSQIAAMNANN
ncbi:MAG: flagellar filament capping protein FliD [Rhodocyclales bacterium]|nr:flagellar filament capping protein FliD [Rhodocyclales bacterium]